MRRSANLHLPFLLAAALLAGSAHARQGEPPWALAHPGSVGQELPLQEVPGVDARALQKAADAAARGGAHTKRQQVALQRPVSIRIAEAARRDSLPDGSTLWRMQLRAAGATDLRLGFGRYALPAGAVLHLIGADGYYQGPYTAADAFEGQFQAPVVPGDTVTISVRVPAGVDLAPEALELDRVGAGFRDLFGRGRAGSTGPGTSGPCNINVVCPLGQPYADESRAVGYYEYRAADDGQYYICSGTLLADVPRTQRNWFLTAAHCIASDSEARSIVVYWNYRSTQCSRLAEPPGGWFGDDQHGASLRATSHDPDVTLLELGGTVDPDWNLYYAGWDASGTRPAGTIGLHHPSGDAQKVTAGPAPATIDSCIAATAMRNTHWRTGPYREGTTEGGSSGSGLFVPVGDGGGRARRLIGTLSGGTAACSASSPTQPDNGVDCYGRFASAWNGSSAAARLRDWLDPAATGASGMDGYDPDDPLPANGRGHSRHALPPILRRPHARH